MSRYSSFLRLLPLLFVLSFFTVKAQTKTEITELRIRASEALNSNQYMEALHLYRYLDSVETGNPQYFYPLGICYLNLYAEWQALDYFQLCLHSPALYPNKLFYYTGKCHELSGNPDSAISYYNQYLDKIKANPKGAKPTVADIKRELEICNNAKEFMAQPLDLEIVNMGDIINSPYPEYGPILSADESVIIFTSGRPGNKGGKIDKSDGHFYDDIYISYKTDSGWSKPVSMGDSINTINHDASISLSADGQKLLIYRYNQDMLNLNSSGDLYMSELRGVSWSNAKKLPDLINSKYWESSASLASDERTLYFTSNRKGGWGGTDIYSIKKLPNGNWALPKNLGPDINTPFDEDSPYIHPDGKTLYFSSKGHKTMGGFDIFVSRFDETTKKWSKPENVGFPINTSHDDVHFSWSADGKKVFFSTIRPDGYGDRDIYFAKMHKESAKLVLMKGVILDSVNNRPLEATIMVTDNNTNQVVGIFNSNSSSGKYVVILPEGKDYTFTIEAKEYEICSEFIKTSELFEFEEINKNIKLCPKPGVNNGR